MTDARELEIPVEKEKRDKALELARVWSTTTPSGEAIYVSLDSNVDPENCAEILFGCAEYIAAPISELHHKPYEEVLKIIVTEMFKELDDPINEPVGGIVSDVNQEVSQSDSH